MNLPVTLPFTLPDWLPAWAFLLLALPVLLYLLAFLIMPFSVFGVKARLEALEAQLDIIQDELRHLGNRTLPSNRKYPEEPDFDPLPDFGRLKSARQAPVQATPPIPPAPLTPYVEPREKLTRLPQRVPRRTEPRLD